MSSIEAQLELEDKMVKRGAEAYLKAQRKAEEKGRGAELDYARRLMGDYLTDLVEAFDRMQTKTGPSKNGRARALLSRIDGATAMYIAMRVVFNSFMKDNQQIVDVAVRVGRQVEDEIRFSRFQQLYGKYYDTIIKDFKRKGTKDYRYMHRVLTHSANENEDGWVPWSQTERADVGCRLIDLILTDSDLLQKVHIKAGRKQQVLLKPTEAAQTWIAEHEDAAQILYADKAPCIIEPDDWSGLEQGGYYSPKLRQSTPMVKVSGALQRRLLAKADLSSVMDSLNTVQKTAYQVNTDVLTIVKAVWSQNLGIGMPNSQKLEPTDFEYKGVETLTEEQQEMLKEWKREAAEIYTKEKARVGQAFQTTRILRMANEYSEYAKFWYVWYYDSRGRKYTATSGFSPQGPDLAKGLLRFAKGTALGPRGLYWMKVHGANRYGFDKCDFDERVAWVDQRHDEFVAAGLDPLSYRETWANADKPYQFLAFLIEYAKVAQLQELGIPASEFVSHLSAGQDGSCNGLQHFSAMLRDPIGGAAVNLVPADKPADIYREVARVCTAKVVEPSWRAFMRKFGEGVIPRSMAKRPVMTLPYGATRQSCTKYIFMSILDADRKHFQHPFAAACSLTPLLWSSISEVVVAARAAMDWLQACSSALTKAGKPVVWTLHDGFVAVQHYRKIETQQVETQLAGRFRVRIGDYTNKIAGAKQRQGISPNFVHSVDAAHLRMTVRLCKANGVHDLQLIHDDYGTHFANVDTLHKCIRAAFYILYTKHDPLDSFHAQQVATGVAIPDLPAKGTLDIAEVLRSPFFFN